MNYFDLSKEEAERVERIHAQSIVFDGAFPMLGFYKDEKSEIAAFRDGGLTGGNATVSSDETDFYGAIKNIRDLRSLIARNSDKMAFVTSAGDLDACKKDGRLGAVAFFQNPKPISDRLDDLDTFYDLGLRIFQLSYNNQGFVGAGCCERVDPGLSEFGVRVVERCNQLGILIDVSHCGPSTSWDAIKFSKAPVVASHSGIYELAHAHGRNKPDDMLSAIAETGGIVGIPFFPCLVKRNPDTHEVLPSTVEDVIDHIDHAVKLMGIDHVAIATDMSSYGSRRRELTKDSVLRVTRVTHPEVFGVGPTDRGDPYPVGIDSHDKMMNLTAGLVKRGYADGDIGKILGGNWMRVFGGVWKN
jgi:membrane dipeptidase